jgi:hypothetical protein
MQASSTPRRNKRLAILICALFIAATSSSQQPKIKQIHASSDHPLWRVDLQSQGFPSNSSDLQRRRGFANFDTISFLSDTVLAATFVTREDIPDLQRREDPNHLRPYSLHAIFLDALTGKVVHSAAWPIENPNAGIFPRPDGGFLLLTTEKIVSYSADWNHLKELPLSDLHPASSATLGAIAESPSYKSLVIQFLNGNFAHCLAIRTGTLDFSPIACGTLDVFTASDNGILAPEKLPGGNDLRENSPGGAYVQYGVAMPDAPSAPATGRILNPDQARSAHTICSPCVGMPQFIDNETIAMYSPTYISLMDRSGQIKFSRNFSPLTEWVDEFGRPVRSSANGLRFAIAANKSLLQSEHSVPPSTTSGVPPQSVEEQQRAANLAVRSGVNGAVAIHMSTGDIPAEFPLDVQVYDLAAAQWIYTLEIKAEHLRQIWGLALSPNGTSLAIDSGGAIQLFTLPK